MINRKIKQKTPGKIQFKLPEINKFSLRNNLVVYHSEKKTLPIIQLKLFLPSGSIFDPLNKKGVATLTSLLVDEGAGNLSGLEISDRIEELGTVLNINSGREFTTVSLLCLKENFIPSIELLSLIITKPTFDESEFNREIKRLESQILQLKDDPSYLAGNYFNKIIYNSTPYEFSSYGTLDNLKNITNDDIKNFYAKNSSIKNSFFITVGDIEQTELEETLNKYLKSWNNNYELKYYSKKIKNSNKQVLLVDKKNAEQSEIRLGHLIKGRNSTDYYSCLVLNTILGGQFSSRLNHNIREVKGYTYSIYSSFNYNQLGGTFSISTSVKSENTIDALREILFELQNIKTTITNKEIDFAKSYLVRRFPSLFETYSQVAANISILPVFDLEKNYFENYIQNVNNITLEKVNKASIDNILLDNLVIVVVGNERKIGNKLKDFSDNNNFSFNMLNLKFY